MIASNIRVPGSYNEIDSSGANNRLPAYRAPMLVVAPKIKAPSAWVATTVTALGAKVMPATSNNGRYYICIAAGTTSAVEPSWPGAGGSVVDGTVTWRELCDASKMIAVNTPTICYSADEAADMAGRGSIAHRMCRAAFRQYPYVELTLITIDDASSGVHATATMTFTGTADGSGSAEIRIGNEKVTVAWEDGSNVTTIAALVDAAIAEKHDLPITSSADHGVVTQRVKNAGVPGNEIGRYNDGSGFKTECTIDGVGISVAITAFASGANDPDITDAFTAATLGHYKLIAIPYKGSDNVQALQAYLLGVSNEVNCKGARAYLGTTATIAIATTLATVNDPRVHVEFVRRCRFTSFEIAAAAAAEHAATGHPSLPLNNHKMKDCDAPAISDRLEFNENNALLWVGVTPWNADGMGSVRCVRSVTSYTVSDAGSADDTYLDTTVIAQLDYNREATRSHDLLLYSNKVLRDNHVDGEPEFVLTPGDINSDHIALFKKLERYGTCQNVDLHKARFVAVKDPNVAGRVNQDIPVQVVEGAHIFANTLRMVTSV